MMFLTQSGKLPAAFFILRRYRKVFSEFFAAENLSAGFFCVILIVCVNENAEMGYTATEHY